MMKQATPCYLISCVQKEISPQEENYYGSTNQLPNSLTVVLPELST